MTGENAPTPTQHFRRGSRLPPLLTAFIVFTAVVTACLTFFGEPRANPDAGWLAPVGITVLLVVVTVAVAHESWGVIEVTDAGLFVGRSLAVPAAELGAVKVLSGSEASLETYTWLRNDRRTHPTRQNRYGGGGGWGKGVLVERLLPGGRSTFWLLAGPRAVELAAALETVRAVAGGRAEDGAADDAWPIKVVRRRGTRR